MKKLFKLLAIIAFIAVIGFSMAACSNGTTGGGGGGGNPVIPPVTGPELTGTVTISGTAEVGQTLTAVTTALGGSGTISYQWKRGEDTEIGTDSTYVIVAADVGFTITVTVTRAGYTGSVTSEPTAVVIAKPGIINVTVTIGTDAVISNPSIVGDILTLNRSATATLTLANSAQFDSDSIRWKVQNTAIRKSGASFELVANNPAYKANTFYFVTVEAERNGVPYDQTITFTVTE